MSTTVRIDAKGDVIPSGGQGVAVRWKVRYRTPDGASRSRTFRKAKDADAFRVSVEGAKQAGGYVDRAAGAVQLSEFGGQWIETRRGRDGALLRPRTKALYSHIFDRHIKPQLGAMKLRDISPSVVRKWHASLPGSTTPAKAYRLLRAMMNTAVDDELIVRNPCRVKNGGVERSPERPLPTGDEVWKLADAIEPRFRALILVAAFVGLRRGELAALRRSDIDIEHRVIHVERQTVEVGGTIIEGPPKSAAGVRTVAMPPVLVSELVDHLDTFVDANPHALVFTGARGAQLRGASFNNQAFDKARKKIGRPRHSFARPPTLCQHAGSVCRSVDA